MPTNDEIASVLPDWGRPPWTELQPHVRDVFRTHGRLAEGGVSLDGLVIGPYGLAGRGAFGAVFRGHGGGVESAVKVFDVGPKPREEDLLSIVRESAGGMAVASPHVVRYDRLCVIAPPPGQQTPAYLLFREFVSGGPPRYDALHKRPADALGVFRSLAAGLRDLHKHGTIQAHRDIRIANAVADGPRAKWVDLGQVRLAGGAHLGTRTRPRSNDPPETWAGGEFDESRWLKPGDVYAFGAMLFFLATGRERGHGPFTLEEEKQVRQSPVNHGILSALLPQMLDPRPAARFPMSAVAEQLNSI